MARKGIFAQSGDKGSVRIWNLAGKLNADPVQHTIKTKQSGYPSLAISEDGRWLATYAIEKDEPCELWALSRDDSPRLHCDLRGFKGEILRLFVTRDASWVVLDVENRTTNNFSVVHAELPTGKISDAIEFRVIPVKSTAFPEGLVKGKSLLLIQDDDLFSLWHPKGIDGLHNKVVGRRTFLLTSSDHSRIVAQYEKKPMVLYIADFGQDQKPVFSSRTLVLEDPKSSDIVLSLIEKSFCDDNWVILEAVGVDNKKKQFVWALSESQKGPIAAKSLEISASRSSPPMFSLSPDQRWLITNATGVPEIWDLRTKSVGGFPESRTPLGNFTSHTFTADMPGLLRLARTRSICGVYQKKCRNWSQRLQTMEN